MRNIDLHNIAFGVVCGTALLALLIAVHGVLS